MPAGPPPDLAPLAGRVPRWARFDPAFYARRYPDAVTLAGGDDPAALRRVYLELGQYRADSPNPFFDERYYLQSHPDVVRAVRGGDVESGFHHYCTIGFPALAPHWLFDLRAYRAANPRLTDPVLQKTGFANHYDHYLEIGCIEARTSHFMLDPAWYIERLDAGEQDAARRVGAFVHLLTSSGQSAAASAYFDPDWYLARYPEVVHEIADGIWRSALHHYLANPTPQAYDPNAHFSESSYRLRYPDIAAAVDGGLYRSAYMHFALHGAREMRLPSPLVDLRHYRQRNPGVEADLDAGLVPDAFVHFLRIGLPRHLSAAPPLEDIAPEASFKRVFRARADALLPIYARAPLCFRTTGVPELSVIVVCHGLLALTMQTLASLRANHPGEMELILVDSGSGPDDGIARIGAFVQGARILRFDTNVSYLRGCNAGLAVARGARILLLNNDVELAHGAVAQALRRLDTDSTIGAVGGKVIRTNGLLQEAGSIVWRDGGTSGYMRDASPLAPEVNFVRDVDYCSAVFLMARADVLRALGGFDPAYAPAYFEDTDLCVRMRASGHRVVYDPSVVIHHLEFGSSVVSDAARALMLRGQAVFCERHAAYLQTRPAQSAAALLAARSVPAGPKPVLFINAASPVRLAGNGAARALAIIGAMADAGHQVTVYPLDGNGWDAATLFRDLPDTVEVMHDRGLDRLGAFLQERAGYYGTVWIGRAGNLNRVIEALDAAGVSLPDDVRLVLDVRPLRAMDEPAVVRHALRHAERCWRIVAASDRDAAILRGPDLPEVEVVAHVPPYRPTPSGWADRRGLLLVAAMHSRDTASHDALVWFIDAVLPLMAEALGPDAQVTVCGYADDNSERWEFANHPLLTARGTVGDLAAAYDSHRVFLAPAIREGSAGYRVQEAAAHGLPVVAGRILADVLGWTDGCELMAVETGDADAYARAIVTLYNTEPVWSAMRDAAGRRLSTDRTAAAFDARIRSLVGGLVGHGAR